MRDYIIHLEPYTLGTGRRYIEHQVLAVNWDTGGKRVLKKLEEWSDNTSEHWQSFESNLRQGGPRDVCGDIQRLYAVSFCALRAELILTVHRLFHEEWSERIARFYNEIPGWGQLLCDHTDQLLKQMSSMANILMLRTGSKGLPEQTIDTFGDGLIGRMENLDCARLLGELALEITGDTNAGFGVGYGGGKHKFHLSQVELAQRIERNYGDACYDKAREFGDKGKRLKASARARTRKETW